jgi:hypothetical protein
MSYFDNLDNGVLNKFKKILKMNFFFIDVLFYLIDTHLNFMQFYYRLIVHQRPLNYNCCKFDGPSNTVKLHENLMDYQTIMKLYEI